LICILGYFKSRIACKHAGAYGRPGLGEPLHVASTYGGNER
jgi:hypothetical protein